MAYTVMRNELGVLELGASGLTRGDIARLQPHRVEELVIRIGPSLP